MLPSCAGTHKAPWHLVWDSQRDNTKGYFVHKRSRKHYHPYTQVVAPVDP